MLTTTNLIGFGTSGSRALTLEVAGASNSLTVQTTQTFTGISIGTAAADRRVLAVFGFMESGTNYGIDSCTLGGNSMTTVVENGDGANCSSAMCIYAEPSGTTANLVVTTTSASNCFVQVYAIYGLSGDSAHDTATARDTSSPSSLNASIDCPAGGIIFGGTCNHSDGAQDYSWTNLDTEDYNPLVGAAGNASMAHEEFATQQTALSITATPDGSPIRMAMALASFGL